MCAVERAFASDSVLRRIRIVNMACLFPAAEGRVLATVRQLAPTKHAGATLKVSGT